MTGFNEFIDLFGEFTIAQFIGIILCFSFMFAIYKKTKEYLISRYEANRKKDEQLEEALAAIRKYPEYRQQSIQIQQKLEGVIKTLQQKQEETNEQLNQMQEENKRRERNKLRDRLLQSHRYYTNPQFNPRKSWTSMEAEAFWELFHDYEDAGGNGYMHTVVQPEMEQLLVVEIQAVPKE